MLSDLPVSLLIIAFALCVYVLRRVRSSTVGDYAPGPRPLPIFGNVFDVPKKDVAQAFCRMSAKYGDLVHLDAFGQPILVPGTHEVAIDLLEKRSTLYSDRGLSTVVALSGWDWSFTALNYGSRWRRHRRIFHQFFNPTAILTYRTSQELSARRLALILIEEPRRFLHHVHFTFVSSIIGLSYGLKIDGDDNYLKVTADAVAHFGALFAPGRYWTESPLLRLLPSWLPVIGTKRQLAESKRIAHQLRDIPYLPTLTAFKEGSAAPSLVTRILQRATQSLGEDKAAEEETIAGNVAGVAYAAGVDTSSVACRWFFLAMASFPDVQKKAQAELDAVVGRQRLPDFSDEQSLPYLSAILKECLRWRPPAPLGVTHCTREDDTYRGFFIPKGTLVIPNVWAYTHDPRHYRDPDTFMPERFLNDGKLGSTVLDPTAMVFGYGRRVCPGRYFAHNSLFITMATVLHTLSIRAPLGADGKPVELDSKMTDGFITPPAPFEVELTPRGPWADALLREGCKDTTEA